MDEREPQGDRRDRSAEVTPEKQNRKFSFPCGLNDTGDGIRPMSRTQSLSALSPPGVNFIIIQG